MDCWAIGPDLPARLAGHVTDRDTFYILPCDAPVPARLRRPVEIAAEKLTVREGRDFTPAHRRLWAEFMNRAVLPPNVRGLFARTGAVLDTPGLRLLDAVDAEGNTAQPAAITIEIKKNKTGLTYSDMDGDPAHYAAIYLAQKGVMTGETIGSCAFFHPSRAVTRSEFIAMTAAAADLSVVPTEQTDFADDSGLSAWAKPYISAAAANGLVSGYATVSGVSEIRGEKTITTAEAGVVLDHLLDGTLNGVQYAWSMSDHSPQDWAQPAMSRLERVSVLTSAQAQNPETPLDRRTACEILYRALILLDS